MIPYLNPTGTLSSMKILFVGSHLFCCSELNINYLKCDGQTMQNPAYRLAEFKIIESEHGDLWWETHMGLGSLKSGKCFINGDILFIAPSDSTGPGFLKGEFIDHLNRLPKWEKTKYYCANYKIYECKSGSRISFFQGLDVQAILGKNGSSQRAVVKTRPISVKSDIAEIISYKLG